MIMYVILLLSKHVIGWLNGRASVFGTEGCGFEPRAGLVVCHFLFLHRQEICYVTLLFDS